MVKVDLRFPRVRSCSAVLQSYRASILRDGARRFYVSTADCDAANLSAVPRASISDCLRAARDWLVKFSSSPCCAFSITERAELPGQSVVASRREVLVFRETFPALKRRGCDSGGGPKALPSGSKRSAPRSGLHQRKKIIQPLLPFMVNQNV